MKQAFSSQPGKRGSSVGRKSRWMLRPFSISSSRALEYFSTSSLALAREWKDSFQTGIETYVFKRQGHLIGNGFSSGMRNRP